MTTRRRWPAKAVRASRRRPPEKESITVRTADGAAAYLEITIRVLVDETNLEAMFEKVRVAVSQHEARRLLVDLREGRFDLTISDLYGLAKEVIAHLGKTLDRLAMVVRSEDMPPEKFFEPSVTSRGLLTLVTVDYDEAAYWIARKGKAAR